MLNTCKASASSELFDKNLQKEYACLFHSSTSARRRAMQVLAHGSSHPSRIATSIPLFVASARGSRFITIEGMELVDFWQGHFSNLLGHNPACLIEAANEAMVDGLALQVGLPNVLEYELAELICRMLNYDWVRFTTSGTLATQAAIALGLSFTGRPLVVKAAGGWHGGNGWSLKGVRYPFGIGHEAIEADALPLSINEQVLTLPFNDSDTLEECFRRHGDRIGVLILEPVLGNSGMVPATLEFLRNARGLTEAYGSVFILDEVVTAFRVAPTTMSNLYGVKPDLVTLGKVMSGGMPLSALCGSREILTAANPATGLRPFIEGGTYSAHPLALKLAARMIMHLSEDADSIYPPMLERAGLLQRAVKAAYDRCGIQTHIPALENPDGITFPIAAVRFVTDMNRYDGKNPVSHWDRATTNFMLRDETSRLALMLRGVFPWQGVGCVVAAHSNEDIGRHIMATEEFAYELSRFPG